MSFLDDSGLSKQIEYIKAYVQRRIEHAIATSAVGKARADADGNEFSTTYAKINEIQSGSTNGTINVSGTDIPVRGLGSAAYTSTSDYASANHMQASNTINALTDYEKANLIEALDEDDTLNTALGKLERALDGKQPVGQYLTVSDTAADSDKLGGVDAEDYALKTDLPVNVSDLLNDAGYMSSVSWEDIIDRPDEFAAEDHTHTTQDVIGLDGYTTAGQTAGSISANDSLNTALAKIQLSIDGKQPAGNYLGANATAADSAKLGGIAAANYVKKSDITTGSTDGTISVAGTDIAVQGLGSMAYENSEDFAPYSHTQAADTITMMTGYTKAQPEGISAINTSDTLNVAIGKLEASLDTKQPRGDYLTTSGIAADSAKLGGIAAADYALLDSPDFTGTPTAITASAGTNTTQIATTEFVTTAVGNAVSSILDGADEALNTLSELSAALGDDPNFATTMATALDGKVDVNSPNYIKSASSSNHVLTLTKGDDTTVTFADTVYTHPDSGVTADSYGPNGDVTGNNDVTISVPQITVDAQGHVTNVTERTYTSKNTTYSAGTVSQLTSGTGNNYSVWKPADLASYVTGKVDAVDTGVMSVTAGATNGTINVDGDDITVYTHPSFSLTAGSYGPSGNISGTNNTSLSVPQITVNANGHITGITSRTYTSKDTTYTAGTGLSLSGTEFSIDNTVALKSEIPTSVSELSNDTGYITGVSWNEVTDKPSVFDPAEHTHLYAGSASAGGSAIKVAGESASANRSRHVWFSYDNNSNEEKRVYSDKFQYNPSTDVLKVGSITGSAGSVDWGDITNKPPDYTASAHTHTADAITAMTGYSKPNSSSSISASDSLNAAVGKLEAALDNYALKNEITSGSSNGKISIAGTDVTVYTHPASNVSAGSYGPSANASPAHGGTFSVPYVTVDTNGHITAASTKTITLPADNDTKVTNTLNTGAKAYVTGTTSNTTNTGTQIFDTGVYLSETAGELVANKFTGSLNGTAAKATADASGNTITSTYATKTELSTAVPANVGSATNPVYSNASGVLTACTYSLNKTVPADAKFTDTLYSDFIKSGANAASGLVPSPGTTAGTTKFLREDATWQVPVDTKVNVTLGTKTKAYLLATSTAPTSTAAGVTAISDTGVYLGTAAGELVASKFTGDLVGNVTGNVSGTAGSVDWDDITDKPAFVTVATSGSYNDLSDTPTNISSFTNDSGYITAAHEINNSRNIEYIVGTQTASTNKFTGVTQDSALYDGKCINYKLPFAGTSSSASLNLTLSDGSTTGEIPVYISNTTRLTTHKGAGQIVMMTYNATNNAWQCDDYWSDSNYYDRVLVDEVRLTAGTNGIKKYSLIMQKPDGTWESLTTTSGQATTKAKNTNGFLWGKIYRYNYSNDIAAGSLTTKDYIYDVTSFDLQYSTNCGTTLTANMSVYLVGTIDNDGLFYLDDTWWTQTIPSTEDGKVYIYLGEAYSTYQCILVAHNPVFWYKDGAFREYSYLPVHTHNYAGSSSPGGAATSADKINTDAGSATHPVYFSNGVPVETTYTLEKSVPSNAVFTDTNTKVTNTKSNTTQFYITGTSSSSTNTGTQYFDTKVYVSATEGELVAAKFTGTLDGTASKATADASGNTITTTYATKTEVSEAIADLVDSAPDTLNTLKELSTALNNDPDFATTMATELAGKSPVGHTHSSIVTVGDQRSVATKPSDYTNEIKFMGIKTKATINNPSNDTYSFLLGLKGWSGDSGGKAHEFAFNNTGINWRSGTGTTWGAWESILTSGSTLNAAKLSGTIPASCYTDTTYSLVTTSADGLMSSADKVRLNHIATSYFGGTVTNTAPERIKVSINKKARWMLAFVVTLYQGYRATRILISGYNYNASSYHWYSPSAIIIADTNNANNATFPVYFGYDGAEELWVAFDGQTYSGVTVDSVTNGYSQIDDYSNAFTISAVAAADLGTIQTTLNPTYVHFSATPVSGRVLVADGTAGRIKTSDYTIAKSVPSNAVFTDTTYSAGTGLSLSGTTFNHSNSVTAGTAGTQSATSGSTLAVPYVTYDAQGHVTASGVHTHTVNGFLESTTKYAASASVGGPATSVAIAEGTTDEARYVWFSYAGSGNQGKACYDADFKYNPSTNDLSVVKINGVEVGSSPKFTDTTYSNFIKSGSTAASGLVPSPGTTAGTTKFLREDATWQVPVDEKVTTTSVTFPSSNKDYYIAASDASATSTGELSKFGVNARIQILAGTASAEGKASLILGNSTAKGTAGNVSGEICLYGDSTTYTTIRRHSGDTTARSLYLPKSGGTLVCHTTDTAIGSSSVPVYISTAGVATACSLNSVYFNLTGATGTKIASNTDLNTLKTAGTYYCENSTTAVTLTNCPYTASNFKLKIQFNGSVNYGRQVLMADANGYEGETWIRSYKNGTWGTWVKVVLSSDTLDATKLSGTIPASCYTNTTYTGSDGITLTGTNFTNSGVRSISTGSANGTISVNTNGTSANVSVYGLAGAAYLDTINNTAKGALGWNSAGATNVNNLRVVNVNSLSYWNGCYNGTSSNLEYCAKGAFGTIVTKNTGDYLPISGGTLTGLLTAKASQYDQISASTAASAPTGGGLYMNNSDITGANAIIWADQAGDAKEGILFPNAELTTWDSIWANGSGVIHADSYNKSTKAITQYYIPKADATSKGSTSVPVYVDSGLIKPVTSLDATKLSGTIPAACYTHTHNYAGSSSAGGPATSVTGTASTNDVSNNIARHVWYSWANTETQRAYDDDFKYNPVSNTLETGAYSIGGHGLITYNSGTGCIEISVA